MPQLLGCPEEEIRLGRDLLQGKRLLQERQSGILLQYVDDLEHLHNSGFHQLKRLDIFLERLLELLGTQHAGAETGDDPHVGDLSRFTLSSPDSFT